MVDRFSGTPNQPAILGFDPGRVKCGIAVMGVDRQLYYHQVVQSQEAIATIDSLCQRYPIPVLAIGDRTTSKNWQQKLRCDLSSSPSIVTVDERYTTLAARDRYWQMYPPSWFYRLIPKGLRQPPRPVDDIVAILLIERYLERLAKNQ